MSLARVLSTNRARERDSQDARCYNLKIVGKQEMLCGEVR